MNHGIFSRIGLTALLLALALALAACGAAPVAEGQVGSASDPRPNQASGIDKALLAQVDAALASKKTAGTNADLAAAQALRDSAVSLDRQGHFEEANGNLKTAAQLLNVLRGGSNPSNNGNALPSIPAVPAAQPIGNDLQGATLVNPKLDSPNALASWEQVGPAIPIGKPVWEVRQGMLIQRGVGAESVDEQTGLVTGNPAWRDMTISAAVLVQGSKEVGLIVRQNGANYYRFRALGLGTGTNNGNLILEKVIDNQATQIATFSGPEISADVWHTLGLSARGTTITCFVDGKQVGVVEDSSFSSGRAGVSTLAMSGAYFANLQVVGR